jgi:outer membrane lipoprotein-sorting protein
MKNFVLTLLLMLALPFAAMAQDLTPAETKAVTAQVEDYFNKVTTVKARFAQANNDGSILGGVFYWWRPSRMRFQYDLPNGDYIVADGLLVHYWDDAVKNYSNAPVGSTLADFLLRKKIKLSGDLQVVSARRPKDNRLILTLVQAKNPEAGDLRMLFRESPMQLLKWRVTDGAGQITEVTLSNIETGVKLDPSLFRFKPPKGYDEEWKNR